MYKFNLKAAFWMAALALPCLIFQAQAQELYVVSNGTLTQDDIEICAGDEVQFFTAMDNLNVDNHFYFISDYLNIDILDESNVDGGVLLLVCFREVFDHFVYSYRCAADGSNCGAASDTINVSVKETPTINSFDDPAEGTTFNLGGDPVALDGLAVTDPINADVSYTGNLVYEETTGHYFTPEEEGTFTVGAIAGYNGCHSDTATNSFTVIDPNNIFTVTGLPSEVCDNEATIEVTAEDTRGYFYTYSTTGTTANCTYTYDYTRAMTGLALYQGTTPVTDGWGHNINGSTITVTLFPDMLSPAVYSITAQASTTTAIDYSPKVDTIACEYSDYSSTSYFEVAVGSFEVKQSPDLDITGLASYYCGNDPLPAPISVATTGARLETRPVDDTDWAVITTLTPASLQPGDYLIRAYYAGDNTYCGSYSPEHAFTVTVPPMAGYYTENFCIGDSTVFMPLSGDSTALYAWDFGDGQRDSTASPSHLYENIGVYETGLTVIDSLDCTESESVQVQVYPAPAGSFTVQGSCEGLATSFAPSVSVVTGTIDSLLWDFGESMAVMPYDPQSDNAVQHTFGKTGLGEVSMEVTTTEGCNTTIAQPVFVFPYLSALDYLETFDNENIETSWANSSQLTGSLSSWAMMERDGGRAFGTVANSGTYYNDERSYIESPCLSFQGAEKPMVSLDRFTGTDIADGAVMEHTTDGGASWQILGELDGGLYWYNQDNITGSPGGDNPSRIGWAGGDSTWHNARYSLEGFQGYTSPVRFRISFASNGDNPPETVYSGFGIDNFSIKERNRLTVLEHFTSMLCGGNDCEGENEYVHNLFAQSPNDVITVQYHTDRYGRDGINQLNRADPSGQALEYAVGDLPYTVIDGDNNHNIPFSESNWGAGALNKQLLTDAPFNLGLSLDVVEIDNGVGTMVEVLEVTTEITKNPTTDTVKGYTILETAIIQKNMEVDGNTYHNVLREMLPNAAGYPVHKDWLPEDESTVTVAQHWNRTFELGETDTLMVVAWLKTGNTGYNINVHQAAYDTVKVMPRIELTVGLGNTHSTGFTVYPNPVSNEINIRFDEPLKHTTTINLIDLVGRTALKATVKAGEIFTKSQLPPLPQGIYFIQIGNSKQDIKKIMVRH